MKENYTSKEVVVEMLAKETGFTKKDLKVMLNGLENVILDVLRDGKTFGFRGLFMLVPYVRKATQRRNPQTGEALDIPEKNAIKCKIGSTLKEAIQ